MARIIYFIDDISFWNSQLDFFRGLSQRNPGLVLCHRAIDGLKRIIREEQKRYKKLYGEAFSMRTVDARIMIDYIRQLSYKPNTWEHDFMASLYEQGFTPTEKQRLCLQRVYEKATGGGVYQNREKI